MLVPLALNRSPMEKTTPRQRALRRPYLDLPNSTSFEFMMLCRLLLGRWAEAVIGISIMF